MNYEAEMFSFLTWLLLTHDLHSEGSSFGAAGVAGGDVVLSTVLPLNVLDHDDAVVTFCDDLYAVLVGFGVIDGPGDGWVGFTCDRGRDPEGLPGSDDNTILDIHVKLNYRLLCFHQAEPTRKKPKTNELIWSTLIRKTFEIFRWGIQTDLQDS